MSPDLLIIYATAFIAGLIDAAVGGGGLVQIPALFGFLPGASPAAVLGTNKLASIAGTTVAVVRFATRVRIHWGAALPAAGAAFVLSFIGARTVSVIPPGVIKPLVLALLVAVAVFTWLRKDFGRVHAPRREGIKGKLLAAGLGGAIGFYDGFFGPGTGTFLLFLFIRFFGWDFLRAAAATKVVNWATNFAALMYFGYSGAILFAVALPMAVFNILGALVGTRMAIEGGSGFIRGLFLGVVSVLIAKFGYDVLRG